MLEIIFISYDEPNADANYARLKARFPSARRVHGIKGIANAHIAAAKKSLTKFFYVVDADAVITDDFDFSYKPGPGDENYVHIWYAFNPAIGISYGYGGVKLFNKSFFKNVKDQLDFSTTLTKDIKVIDKVACTTEFNSDMIRSYRGAFRESAKLYKTINDSSRPAGIKQEAAERLERWVNPLEECAFREHILNGVLDGIAESKKHDNISFINDHDIMSTLLDNRFPEIDRATNPLLQIHHPMQHEFFFTTRIVRALYDRYVLENLSISEIRDAISDGQILSKIWLVEELQKLMHQGLIKSDSKVAILGGWIGTLALMMTAYDINLDITSVDIDERANKIAEKINNGARFQTQTIDMHDVDYSEFDIIINTASEHISDIASWRNKIPSGKILIVQNNDFVDGDGHVSCVKSSNQLRTLLSLPDVWYEGTRDLPIYQRFMIIGRT